MSGPPRSIAVERTLSQSDFDVFAALSGDDNPIHVDPDFAARTRFGRTVAHGVLLYSILRGLAARLVPAARQLSQKTMFPAPTYAGEPMRFSAEVVADDGVRATLAMAVERISDGTLTCTVETEVERLPQREAAS